MKVIVELPERLVKEIRQKVSEGKYSNIASFVLASVENQLVLESEDSEIIEIPAEIETDQIVNTRPQLIENLKLIKNSFPLLEPQNTQLDQNPEKQWIWGQINKIFPIKYVVRNLACEQSKIKDYITFSEFTKKVCSSARSFGLFLKKIDDRNKNRRDEKFSTAFPIGQKKEKALIRFSSQFVGNMRTDGKFVGALADLKFASLKQDVEKPKIGLTSYGFSFEKPEYRIKYGKRKRILLLSNFSSLKKKGTIVNITCDNPEIVLKTPQIRLRYNSEKNCSIGEVVLEGRKIGAKGKIKAELYNNKAETKAIVVQKVNGGPNLEIKVVPEEFGVQRAIWEDNVLKISGKHKSIKRYLGSEEEKYPAGQDRLHFRLLIAEIVAENVASKILERTAEKDKLKFEDYEVSDFYHDHRKYMNEFVTIAHETLITSNEIKENISLNDSST